MRLKITIHGKLIEKPVFTVQEFLDGYMMSHSSPPKLVLPKIRKSQNEAVPVH